jgi:hypothetical protein
LFEVLHEFFEKTNAWQESITVRIVADRTTPYRLTVAEGGVFVRLMALLDADNVPQPAVTDMEGTMTLRDTPNSAATWTAVVAKTISIPVDREGKPQIPEWTIARWYPTIMAGLNGHMMMQNKKPYSDGITGRRHRQRFLNDLGQVRTAVMHGNLHDAQNWRFPQGFVTGSQSSRGGTDRSFGAL